MTEFTSRVRSSGTLNIPKDLQDTTDIEEGDALTVEIKKHTKKEEIDDE